MAEKKKTSSAKVTTKVVATTNAAKKEKKTTKKTAATTSAKPQKTASKKVAPAKKATASPKQKKPRDNYFVGAWRELKQVRWPNRKETWGLTFAVIAYSVFFLALIILLDAFFKYLFDLVIGG